MDAGSSPVWGVSFIHGISMITGSQFVLFLDQLRGQELTKLQRCKSGQLFLAISAQIKSCIIDSLCAVNTEFLDSFVFEDVLEAFNENLKDIQLEMSKASNIDVLYQQQLLLKATKELIHDIKQYVSSQTNTSAK